MAWIWRKLKDIETHLNERDLVQEKHNKDVYIYGLDGDFKRNPFGDICRLLPLSTSITKLYANCKKCSGIGIACFTHRITNRKEQCIIDNDSYIPVCRKCYILLNA